MLRQLGGEGSIIDGDDVNRKVFFFSYFLFFFSLFFKNTLTYSWYLLNL